MAIIKGKRTITLTEKEGVSFLKRMKNPDPEIMEKRDRFIDEARSKIDIKKGKGKIILSIK